MINSKKGSSGHWIVNQFAGSPKSGWGERHFFLSRPLVERGERIVIVSSSNNHMFSQKLKFKGLFAKREYDGVEFLWIRLPPYNPKNVTRFFAMFYFSFAMLALPFFWCKLGKPKSITLSSMSIFPLPFLLVYKKLFQVKFIFEARDLWPLTPIYLMGLSPRNPMIVIIGLLEKWAYKFSDSIVCLFKEAEPYINGISKNPDKFNWIPNGISSNFILDNNEIPNWINQELPKDKLIFCYAGTLGFANALDPLFDVIASNDPTLERVFFLIVGDGYLQSNYKEKVVSKNNVFFTGKLDKEIIPSILKKVDVCFISWHHSDLYQHGVSANKYFDYFAAAKPVLAAQVGITDPVVKSGAGEVVPNTNEGIIQGIRCFIHMNQQERRELGQKGYDYVVENHVYDVLSNKLLKVLSE